MIIQILPRNRLLIDIFGKLLYLFGPDRYNARVRSPIYIHISVYSACNFTKTGPTFLSFWWFQNLACSTHQYLYARWSTFSDRFHIVSFTMQPHVHNWSPSLTLYFWRNKARRKCWNTDFWQQVIPSVPVLLIILILFDLISTGRFRRLTIGCRRKTSCMADCQRNGVKSFVNSACCYGRQQVKTNSFDKIMEMQALLKTNITLSLLAHFSWLRCHYERAGTQLSRIVVFSLKFRYRSSNDFLVSSLQIHFNHSCVKYELHEMKEEDLSFPNMCHLLIINVLSYDKTSIILGFVFSGSHCKCKESPK